VQGAEFFDQHFASDQFQLEIKGALHQNLDGFLRGHGILLPWEWLIASSQCLLLISSAGLRKNLIRENGRREGLRRKKAAAFLVVDTIGKMQHNKEG
jgi:hypothetical protein